MAKGTDMHKKHRTTLADNAVYFEKLFFKPLGDCDCFRFREKLNRFISSYIDKRTLRTVRGEEMCEGYMPILGRVSSCEVYAFTLSYKPNVSFFIDR